MDIAGVEFLQDVPVALQIAIILVSSIIVAKLIELLGSYVLHRSTWLATAEYDRLIIEEVYIPLYVTVFLVGVYVSASLLEHLGLGFYIANTAISIILVLWAYAIVRIGRRVIALNDGSSSVREIAPIFKNILTFSVTIVVFFILLSVWEVNITPVLASAGVIGIILGIAAQDTIGNFFGGISLYLDKTYKIGDMIQLSSGDRGTVIDMSIRSTTILTRDNIAITVPNAEMNSTQVINESAPVRRRRIRLNVGVSYGSNLQTVQKAMLAVADDEKLVLEKPKPVVRFREFGDSAIVAQLQCYIEHPALRGRTRHALIERIDDRFQEEDIKIPFPQREVTFFEAGNSIAIDDARKATDKPGELTVDDLSDMRQ